MLHLDIDSLTLIGKFCFDVILIRVSIFTCIRILFYRSFSFTCHVESLQLASKQLYTIIISNTAKMDIFQFVADFLHLVAVVMLLLKILANKNVIGLSYRTQQLFFVVFLTRYIDLFLSWKTFYAFVMKIVFISLTGYTIHLMRFKRPYSLSLDREADIFPHYYLYGAALLVAVVAHKSLNPIDFLWSFSIWLQSLAILPQLYMINKLRDIENITAHYVLFLGLYRSFYILHWIFQWEYVVWTAFIAGVIQTLLYADFMYYFFKANQNDRFMVFPV